MPFHRPACAGCSPSHPAQPAPKRAENSPFLKQERSLRRLRRSAPVQDPALFVLPENRSSTRRRRSAHLFGALIAARASLTSFSAKSGSPPGLIRNGMLSTGDRRVNHCHDGRPAQAWVRCRNTPEQSKRVLRARAAPYSGRRGKFVGHSAANPGRWRRYGRKRPAMLARRFFACCEEFGVIPTALRIVKPLEARNVCQLPIPNRVAKNTK
jgi:hypothetical protein